MSTIAVIGISIDVNYRGKGIGTKILKLATTEFFKIHNIPIFAYIKHDNVASVKIFERSDFVYDTEDCINDIDCFKYKLVNENR